jgi:hypothetical protein
MILLSSIEKQLCNFGYRAVLNVCLYRGINFNGAWGYIAVIG